MPFNRRISRTPHWVIWQTNYPDSKQHFDGFRTITEARNFEAKLKEMHGPNVTTKIDSIQ